MNELLTAASVLLAVIGIWSAIWYPDIQKALSEKKEMQFEDRKAPAKRLRIAFRGQALPLAVASVLVSVVFLPPTLGIVSDFVQSLVTNPKLALGRYDPIATSIVLVEIFVVFFAVHSVKDAIRLLGKIRE